MKNQEERILEKFENELDSTKYKVYKDSLEDFNEYVIINYQSISVVDFNMPDDDMIYGIGILIFRKSDERIFEIYSHSDKSEQIQKILKES